MTLRTKATSETQITDPLLARTSESETADYIGTAFFDQRVHLVRQGIFHYFGQIAPLFTSLALVPFMLFRLGSEAYGFWIFALAAPGFAAGLDNAFYLSITRETAPCRADQVVRDPATRDFLSACCGAYLAFGLLCAFWTLAIGWFASRHLRLSSDVRSPALMVFVSVAVAFVAGRATGFANSVLSGFQRFGTINALSLGVLIVRCLGFFVLLMRGYGLEAIAAWYLATAIGEGMTALGIVRRMGAFHANRSLVQWHRLRHIGGFGVSALLTTLVQNFWWFSPPMLMGFLSGGASSTASLYAGQRPCFILSELNWRGAEVLFSASAGIDDEADKTGYAELMKFGSQCLVAVALPLSIFLFVLAPTLISLWLRTSPMQTAAVLRVTSVGVIADALWVGPLHVLWGRNRSRLVLMITAVVTIFSFLLNLVAIPRFGPVAAAYSFSASAALGAVITVICAARETSSSPAGLLTASFSYSALPSLALAGFLVGVQTSLRTHPYVLLAVACVGGLLLYGTILMIHYRLRNGSRSASTDLFLLAKRFFRR